MKKSLHLGQLFRIFAFTFFFVVLTGCTTNYNSLKKNNDDSVELIIGSEKQVMRAILDAINRKFPYGNVQTLQSPEKGYTWFVKPLLDQTNFKLTLQKRSGHGRDSSQITGWTYDISTYGTQGLVEARYVSPLVAEIDNILKERRINLTKVTDVSYIQEEISENDQKEPEKIIQSSSQPQFNDDLEVLVRKKSKQKKNPNLFVFSVGISDYSDVPSVPFANRSAIQFAEMAISALGANPENVITLTDKQATSGRIRGRLRTLLNRLDSKDQLIVYFAGHGVPSKDGKAAYLLAQDGGPGSYEESDFELGSLYEQIARSHAGEASIFIDACFSGRSAKDTMLFDGVAPISIAKKRQIDQNGRVSIITAGKGDQFANQYKTRGHRLFGYHLMKTLLDDASPTKSYDLYLKVREKVLAESRRLGPEFEQEPELLGNPNINFLR